MEIMKYYLNVSTVTESDELYSETKLVKERWQNNSKKDIPWTFKTMDNFEMKKMLTIVNEWIVYIAAILPVSIYIDFILILG